MKKKILILITAACCFIPKSQAQHCPFDGTSIVILKVNNKANKTDFVLKEVNYPKADSCRYAEGLLTLKFQPFDSLYADNNWVETYEKRGKKAKLSSKGDFYVTLGQASTDCMLPRNNEYEYIARQFVIIYKDVKTGKMKQIKVPKSKIFSMCTSAGSWERIEAIGVK